MPFPPIRRPKDVAPPDRGSSMYDSVVMLLKEREVDPTLAQEAVKVLLEVCGDKEMTIAAVARATRAFSAIAEDELEDLMADAARDDLGKYSITLASTRKLVELMQILHARAHEDIGLSSGECWDIWLELRENGVQNG